MVGKRISFLALSLAWRRPLFADTPATVCQADWPQYDANPYIIPLDMPSPDSPLQSPGGIITADLTGDGMLDFVVTITGHIAAVGHFGQPLWSRAIDIQVAGHSEGNGLPGHHGPGVAAADIDGDGRVEVLYLTQSAELHVVDGATGELKWKAAPPFPAAAERWEHLVIANFRGQGDRDLLLQTTNKEPYRLGRFIAAYTLEDLKAGKGPLWERDDFINQAHTGARVADIDLDGRDEVLGGCVVGADGQMRLALPVFKADESKPHVDSVFFGRVAPEREDLQVVVLQERDDQYVWLFHADDVIWKTHHEHMEPQNAVIGHFLPADDPRRKGGGMQIWCRSRFNTHQKPFVFDHTGKLISKYEMDDVAPAGWTDEGLEVLNTIDWTGGPQQFGCGKERHKAGDVAVFNPLTGEFVHVIREKADRIFVADVSGDWREEIVVMRGHGEHGPELRIHHNGVPNPRPNEPRKWLQPHYRRMKMTWNYYSP